MLDPKPQVLRRTSSLLCHLIDSQSLPVWAPWGRVHSSLVSHWSLSQHMEQRVPSILRQQLSPRRNSPTPTSPLLPSPEVISDHPLPFTQDDQAVDPDEKLLESEEIRINTWRFLCRLQAYSYIFEVWECLITFDICIDFHVCFVSVLNMG